MRNARVTFTGWSAFASVGYESYVATYGDYSHAMTAGHNSHAAAHASRSHAFSAEWAAESHRGVAVGRWVRLWPDSCDALVLPNNPDLYHPFLVSAKPGPTLHDGWPVGVWITMDRGQVTTRPDVLLPDDGRGYRLRFVKGRYEAGCRSFDTAEKAIAHWTNPKHDTPWSAWLLATEVARHAGLPLPERTLNQKDRQR
jgi:hypothetical protein